MKAGLMVLIGVLGLSGCTGGSKQDEGAGTAQGEVLPGAVSDAMLPLDTVKSQAPLAPKSEGGADGVPKPAAKPGDKSPKAAPTADPAITETAAPGSSDGQ